MTPLHIKARSRLQPDKPSEDLPLWAQGIRRLSFCLRSAPLHSIRTPILFQSTISLPSARIYKGKAVWRLSPFSSGKSCELRDFAYGENLYVLMQDFPPPKVKRLQLVNAPVESLRHIHAVIHQKVQTNPPPYIPKSLIMEKNILVASIILSLLFITFAVG